jgi:hypothetical protein
MTSKSFPGSFSYRNSYHLANAHIDGVDPVRTVSWVSTTSGVDNPRFRTTIRDGGNATTDFTGVKYEVVDAVPHSLDYYLKAPYNDSQRFNGFVLGPTLSPGSPDFTSANNAALGKFYQNARSAISSMKGMTFLGEIAETIHMIKHPGEALFSSFESYLDRLKKVDPRLPRRTRRQILASTYLEYAFGWVPLISDIQDAVKALEKLRNKKAILMVYGSSSDQKLLESGSYNSFMTGTLDPTIETVLTTSTASVKYYGAVHGTASIPSTQAVTEQFGFKIDEFVPTAWELLPWSFLIDYFTNIGDIVSAATFVNSQLLWTSRTNRFEVVRKYNSEFNGASVIKTQGDRVSDVGSSNSRWTMKYTSVNRIANVTPSVPSLQFSLPGSNTRWYNIVALALQNSFLGRRFL